jgi:hypothetical protein
MNRENLYQDKVEEERFDCIQSDINNLLNTHIYYRVYCTEVGISVYIR